MISYEVGSELFQYRAASIILFNEKVLLQRSSHNDLWFIPGGRVEFFESAETTIEREMIEEFDVPILYKKLKWIIENFIEFPDRKVHEIGMFFLVTLPENHQIYLHELEFAGAELGFVNKWVPLNNLEEYRIVPEFVVTELRALNVAEGVKHIINRSVRGIV